jgi:hypothetical protein
MATPEDFAEVEWAVVCDAAHGAGLAMMLVGSSGLVGSMKEMLVAGRTAANAAQHDNELIRAMCAPEAMRAMQTRVAEVMSAERGLDPRLVLRERAVEWLREAVTVVQKKAPGDLEAYRDWVLGFANDIANAASEGGLLGVQGEKVSAEEAEFLASIRAVFAG